MKKLLLVNTNIEKDPYPVPPIGLCMLATRLENRYDVRICDGVFDEGKNLPETVKEFNPDYIGFSIRNIDDIVDDRHIFYISGIISNFIEPVKKLTRVPVILGGSGFSIFPEELMKLTGADWGIIGDATEMLPELLAALDKGSDAYDLPNVVGSSSLSQPQSGSLKRQPSFSSGFSKMYKWLDFNLYKKRGTYSIQTKKGCIHSCVYCTYPVIEGKKYSLRDAGNVVDEICEVLEEYGDVTFEFVDSVFNDPEDHAENICREIIRRKLKIRLRTMGMNPGNTSDTLFELMKAAGFNQIDATPDSASVKMLKNLRKSFCLEDARKMAGSIRKFDMPTMWFFLFGGPGEDKRTFNETMDFIDRYVSPHDLVYLNAGLRVYPGTPLHRIAVRENRLSKEDLILSPPYFYYSTELGKDWLNRMIREAERQRVNCIPALETHPPAEMIAEAMELRKKIHTEEPVFRTLLRVRRSWRSAGKL
jgi:radical SAM superfamily enzyme YgiQ (UPF0313 family)